MPDIVLFSLIHLSTKSSEDKAVELALPLTDCSSLESRPWTSSGQHSRAVPPCVVMGEKTRKTESERASPTICHMVVWVRESYLLVPHSSLINTDPSCDWMMDS